MMNPMSNDSMLVAHLCHTMPCFELEVRVKFEQHAEHPSQNFWHNIA
jgi:hypothetical protein